MDSDTGHDNNKYTLFRPYSTSAPPFDRNIREKKLMTIYTPHGTTHSFLDHRFGHHTPFDNFLLQQDIQHTSNWMKIIGHESTQSFEPCPHQHSHFCPHAKFTTATVDDFTNSKWKKEHRAPHPTYSRSFAASMWARMEVALSSVLESRSLHLAVRLSTAVRWGLEITPTLIFRDHVT